MHSSDIYLNPQNLREAVEAFVDFFFIAHDRLLFFMDHRNSIPFKPLLLEIFNSYFDLPPQE